MILISAIVDNVTHISAHLSQGNERRFKPVATSATGNDEEPQWQPVICILIGLSVGSQLIRLSFRTCLAGFRINYQHLFQSSARQSSFTQYISARSSDTAPQTSARFYWMRLTILIISSQDACCKGRCMVRERSFFPNYPCLRQS